VLILRRTIVLTQHLVSSLSLGDFSTQVTRGRVNMSTIVFETCTVMNKCIKIKNLCIKLLNKDYHYIRMHGQQNVKINYCVRMMCFYSLP